MIAIPITAFADFCAARKTASQMRIVQNCWELDRNPEYIDRRDFYGPLRRGIIKYHLTTGDLSAFEEALPHIPSNPKHADRKPAIQAAGRAYIEYCHREGVRPFSRVQRVEVELTAGVSVRVNPELVIRNAVRDEFVVKLWYRSENISQAKRETYSYLLRRAKELGAWSPNYRLATLDIRRQRLLLPPIITEHVAENLQKLAERFAEIWATFKP